VISLERASRNRRPFYIWRICPAPGTQIAYKIDFHDSRINIPCFRRREFSVQLQQRSRVRTGYSAFNMSRSLQISEKQGICPRDRSAQDCAAHHSFLRLPLRTLASVTSLRHAARHDIVRSSVTGVLLPVACSKWQALHGVWLALTLMETACAT